MTTTNNFLDLEKVIGTEAAFNILMVENNIRKSFFEALRFSTMLKLNKYMKKYKILLEKFTNIDLYIFEIDENSPQIIIRFMVYHKKYENDVKKIKSYKDHKEIGYMLDYSCPRNLDDNSKVMYSLILIKDEPNIYQHNWINPNKINILKKTKTQLFSYGCTKIKEQDYNNINMIGTKCIKLLKYLNLPYKISVSITYQY